MNSFIYHGKKVIIFTGATPEGDDHRHIVNMRTEPDLNQKVRSSHDHGHQMDTGHSEHNILTIDNIPLHVMKLSDGGYKTHYLPYWSYSSLEDLSRDIIDMTPRFNSNLLGGK